MEGLHTWRQVNKTALTERLFRKNTAEQRISGRNQPAVEAMSKTTTLQLHRVPAVILCMGEYVSDKTFCHRYSTVAMRRESAGISRINSTVPATIRVS